MLQGAWTRNGPILGYVTHQEDGNVIGLGHVDQGYGHLPYLGRPSRDSIDLVGNDGLGRIDDDQVGLLLFDKPQHRGQICCGGQEE